MDTWQTERLIGEIVLLSLHFEVNYVKKKKKKILFVMTNNGTASMYMMDDGAHFYNQSASTPSNKYILV